VFDGGTATGEGELSDRTPTETIIAAMEEAETATNAIIVMTTKDGDILTLATTSVLSTRLGLLEMAKALIISDLAKNKEL